MKNKRTSGWIVVVVGMLLTANLHADVLILKNGGRVEGELLNYSPTERPSVYTIQTVAGGTVKLSRAQVAEVIRKSDTERAYDEILPKMPATVDGNWKMAEWCRESGLANLRDFHLEQIVRLDPNHEEARYGLGYSKVDGRWVMIDEYNRSQGYVRYKGAWRTKQDVAIDELSEQRELAEKQWRRDLKIWRNQIGKRRHQEALAAIKSIDDDLAAMAVAEMLEDEPLRDMKLVLIEVLGRLSPANAKTALITAAIEDDDDKVREACLRELQNAGTQQAVRIFEKCLDPDRQKDNYKINRAGIALAWMKDEDAIPALIDSLVTEHKITLPGGGPGQVGATFGGPGAGGLSMNKKPQVIMQPVQNEGVLYALKELSREDFRFDQDRWRDWYAEANTPNHVNLRRSD